MKLRARVELDTVPSLISAAFQAGPDELSREQVCSGIINLRYLVGQHPDRPLHELLDDLLINDVVLRAATVVEVPARR